VINRRRRFHNRESCPYSPFSVILVCLRIAEIHEKSVALVTCYEPVVSMHGGYNYFAKAGEEVTVVLNVHPLSELNRADEVAEHHRELPSLGLDAVECNSVFGLNQ
jgi:hypothetical protein